jgi:hypothetical protein
VTELLERGDIAFFYRPRVRSASALEAPRGIQRFFAVLMTAGGAARRLRIGRNRLPARAGQRFWAQVERTGSLDRVLAGQLEDEHYVTRTRGERYQPAAVAVARGSYALVRHGDHIHLAFRVEHAEEPDTLPEEVRVPAAASYVLLFKRNPGGHRPRERAGSARSRGERAIWTTAGDPAILDEEDAEIVLVGARDEPEEDLGIDLLAAG